MNILQQANALTPSWMKNIHFFDGLEVHPVREYHENGYSWCEQCEPEEAEFWSVYGHLKEGEVDCFEDFETEAEADAFAEKLLTAWPHLRR